MGKVVVNMSMSLDGFVAGPDVSVEHPMGRDGERLHEWMFGDAVDPRDAEMAAAFYSPATMGAVLMGRRTFTVGEAPWGKDGTFRVPCFVVTHRPAATVVKGPTTFTFVTEGLDAALERARMVAGGKEINVMGASLVQQCLRAGLVDELQLTVVPILLGAGARLFESSDQESIELEQLEVVASPVVTHLRLRVK